MSLKKHTLKERSDCTAFLSLICKDDEFLLTLI